MIKAKKYNYLIIYLTHHQLKCQSSLVIQNCKHLNCKLYNTNMYGLSRTFSFPYININIQIVFLIIYVSLINHCVVLFHTGFYYLFFYCILN